MKNLKYLLAVLLAVTFLPVQPAREASADTLAGYTYRKAVTVTNPTANITIPITAYAGEDTAPLITLGTSSIGSGWALADSFQRKMFFMAGRLWVFYSDGGTTGLVYQTSLDGITWSRPLVWRSDTIARTGMAFAIAFDGTYLHYVFNGAAAGDDLFYRRGTPNADGTVTWSAAEQTVRANAGTENTMYPNIAVDTSGYPWVAFTLKPTNWPTSGATSYITKSSTNDGTWATAGGFPYALASNTVNQLTMAQIVALTAGKMYAAYSTDTQPDYYYGKLYNAGWGSAEQATHTLQSFSNFGLLADGDDVWMSYWGDNGGDNAHIYANVRTYGVGWGAGATIGTWVNTLPGLTRIAAGNVIVSWATTVSGTTGHVYYNEYTGGAWQGVTDWIDDSGDTIPTSTSFMALVNSAGFAKLAVAYTAKAGSPYDIRLRILAQDSGQVVVLENHAQSDFDDLHFTRADGSTEISNYWLQDKSNSEYAQFWVLVPAAENIYTYYGNAGATSLSSGTNTFLLFDDFNRADSGTVGGGWTETTDARWEILSNQVRGNFNNQNDNLYRAYTVSGKVEFRHQSSVSNGVRSYSGLFRLPDNKTSEVKFTGVDDGAGTFQYWNGAAYTDIGSYAINTNYVLSARVDSAATASSYVSINSGPPYTATDYASASTNLIQMYASVTVLAVRYSYTDWFFARQWVSTEPVLSWGGEESFLPPTVTTQAASSIGNYAAVANGTITATGGENSTAVFVQYGLTTGVYTANFTESGNYGAAAFTVSMTGLSSGTTYFIRMGATNSLGNGYGSEVSFTTVVTGSGSYNPGTGTGVSANVTVPAGGAPDTANNWQFGGAGTPYIGRIIVTINGTVTGNWTYDYLAASANGTFTDQSGYGNHGTPSFRTASSDADVSAQVISFAPISVAIPPPYAVTDPPDFISTNITVSGNFQTGNVTTSLPGQAVVDAAADTAGVPNIWLWGIIGMVTVAMGGIGISAMERKFGSGGGTLLFRIGVGAVVFGLFITWGIFDFWMLIFYLFIAITPAIASRQGDIGAQIGELNFIGFLSQVWLGLTVISRIMQNQLITSDEVGHLNTMMFTQDFRLLDLFSVPIVNFNFFTQGLPALLKWKDYGTIFTGNAQFIEYLLYSLTAIAGFIVFVVTAGMITSYFTKRTL